MLLGRLPALALSLTLAAASTAWAEDRVSVFLELDGPSLSEVALGTRAAGPRRLARDAATTRQRKAELQSRQAALEPELAPLNSQITGRFISALNCVRVLAPPQHLPKLASLPGVRSVRRAQHYRPLRASSVAWVGAPTVWSRTLQNRALTGAGIRIGVIDSGIDYLHADFGGPGTTTAYSTNNPTRIEADSFPTAKVAGGWDFVGDRYDAGDPLRNIPQPDPDPLDPAANGHGTHVAGIAAGFGVLLDGTTFQGPYDAYDPAGFRIAPGVAPEATLYALKVFGATGSTDAVVDALDWATDPNSDGDLSDRLDVLVLSLGGSFGTDDPGDLELKAIDRLARLGTVLAIAAGNDGNTSYILGNPGVAPAAVTVANSVDGGVGDPALEILEPPALAGLLIMSEGALTPPLSRIGPVTAELALVEPADACETLVRPEDLSGRIAFLDRGTCFFVDKIRAVQAAGAIGVVVANNVDSPPLITMSANGDASDLTIPAVMVTRQDGARIREEAARNRIRLQLANHLVLVHTNAADQLDDSSSRGPVRGSHRLKPDLAAPGSRIASGRAGSGSQEVVFSGTSMAAPHVAGAAAILRQLHPDWPAEDIKAALINTTVPTHDASGQAYPSTRTGAGRLQLDRAAATWTVVKADNDQGEVLLSFGAIDYDGPRAVTQTVKAVNHGPTDITLNVSVTTNGPTPGVTVRATQPQLQIPARSEATFQVLLELEPTLIRSTHSPDPTSPDELSSFPRQPLREVAGELRLENQELTLRLPWHAVPRPLANHLVTTPSLGLPANPTEPIALATRGPSAHPNPLVTLLQLGALDTDHAFGDTRSATDLIAVGVASDFRTSGSISNTTVIFGLATSGPWITPQRAVNRFDVQIDVDSDGSPDFTVVNANTGTLEAGDPDFEGASTDAFISVVRDEATGDLLPGWPLNLLSPGTRDTRLFGGSVLLLAAQAADIGLTERRSGFRYRVETDGDYADRTAWISFNAAQPALDSTPHGLQGTPIFDEGRPLRMDALRPNANPTVPPKVLLLHHHHPPGQQVEVVTLDWDNLDHDADGLPDVWELEAFGDLSFRATDDPDRDGLINAEELNAGSLPDEVRWLPLRRGDPTLRWFSHAGRWFTIERAETIAGEFHPIRRHLPAVEGVNEFLDPAPPLRPANTWFYRLRSE